MITGDKWRMLRKIVNPTFHMKLLEMFMKEFNRQGEILVKVLEKKAENELFDIHPYMAKLTVDTICGKKNLIIL